MAFPFEPQTAVATPLTTADRPQRLLARRSARAQRRAARGV